MATYDNWVHESTGKEERKRAERLAEKHKHIDAERLKSGLKKIYVKHPTLKNTLIEKFV